MVKRFFSSVARFLFLAWMIIGAIYGVAQLWLPIPHKATVNEFTIFAIGLLILLRMKSIIEDMFFWSTEVHKILNEKE
jgi:hydrogenase/urease accessory protein HupE